MIACAASCGGGSAPPLADVVEADFPSLYAQTYCDALGECCAATPTEFTRESCMTIMTNAGQSLLLTRGALAVYDGRGARDCIDKTREVVSECLSSNSVRRDLYEACRSVKRSTIPVGASCNHGGECAPVMGCVVGCVSTEAEASVRECFVDAPGLVGDRCMGGDGSARPFPGFHLTCAEGLLCNDESRCVPRLPDGATCTARDNCRETSWCTPTDRLGSPGSCTPKVPLGADCSTPMQCTTEACYQGKCARGEPIGPRECNSRNGVIRCGNE
jgi:hypothetical protein